MSYNIIFNQKQEDGTYKEVINDTCNEFPDKVFFFGYKKQDTNKPENENKQLNRKIKRKMNKHLPNNDECWLDSLN